MVLRREVSGHGRQVTQVGSREQNVTLSNYYVMLLKLPQTSLVRKVSWFKTAATVQYWLSYALRYRDDSSTTQSGASGLYSHWYLQLRFPKIPSFAAVALPVS